MVDTSSIEDFMGKLAERLNAEAIRIDAEGGSVARTIACALGFVKEAIKQELASCKHPDHCVDSNDMVDGTAKATE